MKSLRSRITWSFLLLIGCSVLGIGIFEAVLLKTPYIDSLTTRLSKEGVMVAETVDWQEASSAPDRFQGLAGTYNYTLGTRVTFYDEQGRVLGDSANQALRGTVGGEDVQQVLLSRGASHSQRVGEYLLVTTPVIRDGQVVGAVRLSFSLHEIDQSLQQVWLSLAGGVIIAYLVAAFFSSYIASGVTKPLEEMIRVASDITKSRVYRRVQQEGEDEVARLGQAINRMAYGLQSQMDSVRKSERRLTSVIETMESGLMMIDATGRISLVNRAFEDMLGIVHDGWIGMPYTRLPYSYDLSALITASTESGTRIRKEIHLYYPEERVLEVNLAPMWVEKEGVGVVIICHDLTAIRRLEQLRKDFVANVSHELKTPITSISGFAETLLDGALKDPALCREFLQIIYDESVRLQRLVTDILDLSKIESKQLPLRNERIELGSLIQSVVKTLEEQVRNNQQTLHIHVPIPFTVCVDPDGFRQILLNLVANAVNYTPHGGSITLTAERNGTNWTLQVRDTGIGIPEADLARIFERFYRVDKARARDSGGTGLGLAIVKHLVEAHRGEIHVQSQVGKGTTFTLTFPLDA